MSCTSVEVRQEMANKPGSEHMRTRKAPTGSYRRAASAAARSIAKPLMHGGAASFHSPSHCIAVRGNHCAVYVHVQYMYGSKRQLLYGSTRHLLYGIKRRLPYGSKRQGMYGKRRQHMYVLDKEQRCRADCLVAQGTRDSLSHSCTCSRTCPSRRTLKCYLQLDVML